MNLDNLRPAMQYVINHISLHGEFSEFDLMALGIHERTIRAMVQRGICEVSETGSVVFTAEAAAHFNKPSNDAAAVTDATFIPGLDGINLLGALPKPQKSSER